MTGDDLDRLRAGVDERIEHPARARAVEGSVHHRIDATEDRADSPDMVGVPVREDEEIDALDAEE